jgi:hypothetical protein
MPVKTLVVGCAFIVMHFLCPAQKTTIEKTSSGDKISFSVARETNIYNYVVEGADDSVKFEIIGVIKAKGYSMNTLKYDFLSYEKSYRNYRIKQIDMSGSCVIQMRVANIEIQLPMGPAPKAIAASDTSGG